MAASVGLLAGFAPKYIFIKIIQNAIDFLEQKKDSPARYDRGRIFLLFLLCLFGHRFFAFTLGSVFFSHIVTYHSPGYKSLDLFAMLSPAPHALLFCIS
jgi:hypothetical protein